MTRRGRRPEPTCPRCGNEQDLFEWLDGRTYCAPCIQCPHEVFNNVMPCVFCVRQLYSIPTFQGWRIIDVEYYVREAWQDYGLDPSDLQLWTFGDNEIVGNQGVGFLVHEPKHDEAWRITKPPPHHRFTSSGGSR